MIRVLLVDDEPMILRSMRRMLGTEVGWQTSVCTGGAEALAILESTPVDVIVSDLNMPGMNGISLLEQVRARHPGIVRFVLSGHAEQAEAVRLAAVAHQFLAKPCNTAQLRRAISRVFAKLSAMKDSGAGRHLASLHSLPPVPQTLAALTGAVENEMTSSGEIADLLGRDVALAAKVLQLVNTAFFGMSERVVSVEKAVLLLGTSVLRAIVTSQELFRAFPAKGQARLMERLHEHSSRTAVIARRISANRAEADLAFMAALLHDAGKLVLISAGKDGLGPVAGALDGDPPEGDEHAAVGACLLALWGLPDEIVDAVLWHHQPRECPLEARRLAALVHVADALAHEHTGNAAESPLDVAFLEEMDMAGQLAGWRSLVRPGR